MLPTVSQRTTALWLCALALWMGIAAPASAESPDVRAAEELVLAVYFEGLPQIRARELTPAGAEHLVEMLRAGDHQPFHSNIVLALGISGHSQAFATLEWYGRDEPGEVPSGVYRARVAVPVAMGHLAASDDRALAWLAHRARAGTTPPRWGTAGVGSASLAETMRAQVLNGLAVSGRSAAAEMLNEIAEREADPMAGAALQLFHQLHAPDDSIPGRSR